jgi:hypothetical protein
MIDFMYVQVKEKTKVFKESHYLVFNYNKIIILNNQI